MQRRAVKQGSTSVNTRMNSQPLKRIAAVLVTFATLSVLMNCGVAQTSSDRQKYPSLAIDGFNYTDFGIELFYVDGTGGGPLSVSTETSGGGGTTCCFRLYPTLALTSPIEIKWARYINGKYRWCKKSVRMTGPLPDNPTDLGVHFMPDGNIIVQASHFFPDMKLALKHFSRIQRNATENVIHDEEVATCSDTQ